MDSPEVGRYFHSVAEWKLASRVYWRGRLGRVNDYGLAEDFDIPYADVISLKAKYRRFMNHKYKAK